MANGERSFDLGPADRALKFYSMDELIERQLAHGAESEDAWLVSDLLPRTGLALLAADAKAGKTTLAMELAGSVVGGQQFLGRACFQGPVLYCAMEGQEAYYLGMVRRHVGEPNDRQFLLGRIDAERDHFVRLHDVAEEINPALIVMDTMAGFTAGLDTNKYDDMSAFAQRIQPVAEARQALILVLHHNRRTPPEGSKRPVHYVHGSAAIGAAYDVIMVLLENDEHSRTLKAEGREIEYLEHLEVRLDDHRRPYVFADGQKAARERAQEMKLLNCLHADGWSNQEWLKASGLNKSDYQRARDALLDQGLVLQKMNGRAQFYEPAHGR